VKVSSHVQWRALPESISKPTQHCAVEARERRACNGLVAADIDDAEAVTFTFTSSIKIIASSVQTQFTATERQESLGCCAAW
jgi:hypothetical protein